MPAYIIAHARIGDPQQYEDYKRLAAIAVCKYGCRYLAQGGQVHVLEGEWRPSRIVILQCDSLEQAHRFYNLPEYQSAKLARRGAAAMEMVVVEGLEF